VRTPKNWHRIGARSWDRIALVPARELGSMHWLQWGSSSVDPSVDNAPPDHVRFFIFTGVDR
jgi:hypothetical protein